MIPVRTKGNPVPVAPVGLPKAAVKFGAPMRGLGHRILLYGTGGIGKTTLAAMAPKPAFIDLDESLGKLGIDKPIVEGISTWVELRAVLQGSGWEGVQTIVIDTVTKAEELAVAHTLMTVKHEKGRKIDSIEAYGYGKGYSHVYETFMGLLADIDRHSRAGRNTIFVCHECITTVPNPRGEDFKRFEPRLQDPTSGKMSIRARMKEWSDHTLFLAYDIEAKEKKGIGSGTRTMWTSELPFCMAKCRSTQDLIAIENNAENGEQVWKTILGK